MREGETQTYLRYLCKRMTKAVRLSTACTTGGPYQAGSTGIRNHSVAATLYETHQMLISVVGAYQT